jgi:hypothetical protein
MSEKEQKTAKFALVEKGIPPYELGDFEKPVNISMPEEGTGDMEGFYIYEGTEKFAAHIVLTGGKVVLDKDNNAIFTSGRYKLLGEKALDGQYRTPRGAIIFVKIEPERYIVKTRQVIEDSKPKMENGKPVYEKMPGVWEKVQKKAK